MAGRSTRVRWLPRLRDEIAPHRRATAVGALLALPWAWWVSGPGWSTAALLVATLGAVPLFVIDVRTHRLPNALTYPTTAVVGLLLLAAGATGGTWDAVSRSLLGALVLGAAYLLLHLVNPSGLGFGDVKLSVLLGMLSAWFGWPVLWATAMLPFLLGGVVALGLLAARRATRTTAIAFGPFMLAGTALALTTARLLG